MKKSLIPLSAVACFAVPTPVAAETPVIEEREASIPFLHIGRMRTFRAIDERTLYIEARRREWYRATTFSSCINLPWARVIGVDNHGGAVFDRSSSLIVDGERCALRSVVRSGEPPTRRELRELRRRRAG